MKLQANNKRFLLSCGVNTVLEVTELHQEGRKRIAADAFWNGQHPTDHEKFGG